MRQAEVKNADETGWKLAGALCRLWAAASTKVVAFVIHARRSAAGLTAILGLEILGILCGDRWGPYMTWRCSQRRQICWGASETGLPEDHRPGRAG